MGAFGTLFRPNSAFPREMVKIARDDDDKKNRPLRRGPPLGWLNVNQQRL
jgi:hypothetical protein